MTKTYESSYHTDDGIVYHAAMRSSIPKGWAIITYVTRLGEPYDNPYSTLTHHTVYPTDWQFLGKINPTWAANYQ